MFGHEVAELAAVIGELRGICKYRLKGEDRDDALVLIDQAEAILTSPNGDSEQRAKWREQKREQRSRRSVSADMSADTVGVEVGVAEEVGVVGEEVATPTHAPAKKPRTTWLTPVEQALDRTGFTIPKAKTEPTKAKAFYSWIGKELNRAFALHGGTDREAFIRYVVWAIEEDIGGRWPSDIEGDPLKCVRYLAAVLRNPEVVERYKVAMKPKATTADLERWQAENDRKIAEARAAGAYGPLS